MVLALEVLGALTLGISVRQWLGGPARQLTAPSVALLAVAAMAIAFWSAVWSEGHTLVDQHSSDSTLTSEQANAVAGNLFPANDAFLSFAAATVPSDATVYLWCGPAQAGCYDGLSDWISFRLSPRVFVSQPGQAQWVVVYGASPGTTPFRIGQPLSVFGPDFATGRRL
jgi:hypothetical protein